MSAFAAIVCGGHGSPPVKLLAKDYLPQYNICCYGAASDGATGCTCWRPVYDHPQRKPKLDAEAQTQPDLCIDCAFRKGSREREAGLLDGIDSFWCHQGLRKAIKYKHPDGRIRDATPDDYDPPILGIGAHHRPYRFNGEPALKCAGMERSLAALRRVG